MKNKNSKIMALSVTAAVITVGIYLFRPKDAEVSETTQPVPVTQEQNQLVPVTEIMQEPANSSELTKDTLLQSETAPEQTPTSPITAQQSPQIKQYSLSSGGSKRERRTVRFLFREAFLNQRYPDFWLRPFYLFSGRPN
jgi:hypothetical protein